MISIDDYDLGQLLGRGGFASVHRARNRRNGQEVAIKIIDKEKIKDFKMKDRVENEIRLQKSLSYCNIVSLYEHFEDDSFVYMALELCPHGNLYKYLKINGRLSESLAARIMQQILSALKYMQNKNIVHRDIKLSNIVIFDKENMVVKVCDFGLAIQISHPDDEHFTVCGTPNYIAPEIAAQISSHSFPADLWSAGCLFYSMVTGFAPFEDVDVRDTLKRVQTGDFEIPSHLSNNAVDFIKSLLNLDPRRRARIEDVMAHPYLSAVGVHAPVDDRQGTSQHNPSRGRVERLHNLSSDTYSTMTSNQSYSEMSLQHAHALRHSLDTPIGRIASPKACKDYDRTPSSISSFPESPMVKRRSRASSGSESPCVEKRAGLGSRDNSRDWCASSSDGGGSPSIVRASCPSCPTQSRNDRGGRVASRSSDHWGGMVADPPNGIQPNGIECMYRSPASATAARPPSAPSSYLRRPLPLDDVSWNDSVHSHSRLPSSASTGIRRRSRVWGCDQQREDRCPSPSMSMSMSIDSASGSRQSHYDGTDYSMQRRSGDWRWSADSGVHTRHQRHAHDSEPTTAYISDRVVDGRPATHSMQPRSQSRSERSSMDGQGKVQDAAKSMPLPVLCRGVGAASSCLPPFRFVSDRGDLLMANLEGDIVFCSTLNSMKNSKKPNASVSARQICITIRRKNPLQLYLALLNTELASGMKLLTAVKGLVLGHAVNEGEGSSNACSREHDDQRSSAHEQRSEAVSALFCLGHYEKCYSINCNLPRTIRKFYMRIYKLLELVRSRVPKLVLYLLCTDDPNPNPNPSSTTCKQNSPATKEPRRVTPNSGVSPAHQLPPSIVQCKCILMSDMPMPSFCIQWRDGAKLRYSLSTTKLAFSKFCGSASADPYTRSTAHARHPLRASAELPAGLQAHCDRSLYTVTSTTSSNTFNTHTTAESKSTRTTDESLNAFDCEPSKGPQSCGLGLGRGSPVKPSNDASSNAVRTGDIYWEAMTGDCVHWAEAAPAAISQYLLVAQFAIRRCMEEQDKLHGRWSTVPRSPDKQFGSSRGQERGGGGGGGFAGTASVVVQVGPGSISCPYAM